MPRRHEVSQRLPVSPCLRGIVFSVKKKLHAVRHLKISRFSGTAGASPESVKKKLRAVRHLKISRFFGTAGAFPESVIIRVFFLSFLRKQE
ncbi:Uncharacterized protein dnm_045190 [Desulfonema magnum]|uniref:Uncharacterized protein n=1 Tax=Desulfonema magnum TaxID=45655 RepID=A0A975BNJ7_9BACT|nr:Uncharacterized protein dnm_045190 [Desulfonema magnum]